MILILFQYHYNLWAVDDQFNPVVMSIKPQDDKLTIIVRTKQGSKCLDVIENPSNPIDHVDLCKQVYPEIQIDRFENCTNFKVRRR